MVGRTNLHTGSKPRWISDPHKIIFYLKSGISMDIEDKEGAIAEIKQELKLKSTDGDPSSFEIMRFKHYCELFEFVYDQDGSRQKNMITQLDVSVCFDVELSDERHFAR